MLLSKHIKLGWFKVFSVIPDQIGLVQRANTASDVEIMAVGNDKKGWFETLLECYDNPEQAWITLEILEPLEMLAKQAACGAASD